MPAETMAIYNIQRLYGRYNSLDSYAANLDLYSFGRFMQF